jgi:hypothetical protein
MFFPFLKEVIMAPNNENKENESEAEEIASIFKDEEITRVEEESIIIECDTLNFSMPDENPVIIKLENTEENK